MCSKALDKIFWPSHCAQIYLDYHCYVVQKMLKKGKKTECQTKKIEDCSFRSLIESLIFEYKEDLLAKLYILELDYCIYPSRFSARVKINVLLKQPCVYNMFFAI